MPNSNEHIVTSYEDELTELARSISEMGGLVEKAITNATDALIRSDADLALATVAADKKVDAMQSQIDEMAVSIIARRQPMAQDLRLVIASIHVANDLERIGDMAKSTARRSTQFEGIAMSSQFKNGLRHMGELVQRQVKLALDAFAARDKDMAVDVVERDTDVDALYVSLFRELLTYMMEDPRNITMCTHLLFCGKNLERVGDHSTNIAEQAYFLATGKTLTAEAEDFTREQIKG
ncbi:phosphate signaling complex protein PhoU [Pelagibacterium halotolerans]|uniref:Phosphate-specific transport system accessory protein PhoU n=1 Tax=Pelagibacterium halotolerans (strain DSM 22347 / JCM 15775 / CGMCC 1.7692 / B2) TaxID=1082931 RepID=G4R8R6_PELHB|nr:phosphate signaling complex protein PhoU [Pelagibacterium halotolerans]AEQ50352.1 phosphate transport system regulatory protein PhoU [Pelagibacterium halotolerans B2]QJR19669.1 phosphate signaling complex protein PhoU [Pelagibacterium halotolerans]SEA98461.1 phosphate transport system protein [Pelagibacterium halotolerans]